MKFKFKIQQYQTDAVEQTVNVFSGQKSSSSTTYRRDLGNISGRIVYEEEYTGYRNADVSLNRTELLENIQKRQAEGNIKQSKSLVVQDGLGACSLDIEMETGTGKTYVYIKTMFEMNKRYGWTKFIVVVPSIAIREGVQKSFQMLEDHFMEQYGKKARFFVYNSSQLTDLEDFSSSASIQVMIINVQAFNSSFKEGKKQKDGTIKYSNKEARIIYSVRDDFQSRRPIDVIAANRPIIVMDEPQKMEGEATQKALKHFKPLFIMNYSATHKTSHNCIYALDAYDAYRQRLVKKIQVKGITVKNLTGTQSYIFFDSIQLSKNKAPEVWLEIEVAHKSGNKRERHRFNLGDRLIDKSELKAYEGYTITNIDGLTNTVDFLNGVSLHKGEIIGDISEAALQRIQIRETIASHFEKEEKLFNLGIKTLSLFFIDEVANYKGYNDQGEEIHGPLWKMFEEEYMLFLNEHLSLFDSDYQRYLRAYSAAQVHSGYFSIDKKGHAINSEIKRGESFSTDITAYDLILKNKEALLSLKGETGGVRFIFSHSALREGWDNPNVFQICTLRHTNSATTKRQEVGRGLRICVDSNGDRMDAERLGDDVHNINCLTVIANENYSSFVDALQKETREALRERPTLATIEYFMGKTFKLANGETHTIDEREASRILIYLEDNDYIDNQGIVLQTYHDDVKAKTLVPMGKKLEHISEQVHKLVQGLFDPSVLDGMIENANESAVAVNERLNDNASKEEFKRLWSEINHQYVYTVHYNSDELIEKAINSLDAYLYVSQMKYIVTTGEQGENDLEFATQGKSDRHTLKEVADTNVTYDLVGEIAKGAKLTRQTAMRILKGIRPKTFACFQLNPEEFIRNAVRIIREEKATMIVDHISYNRMTQKYDTDIFTATKSRQPLTKAYAAKRHILDYVFWDSKGELDFAKDLDTHDAVCVYAKLPRTFQIPTPVGDYAPDWAIAFHDNKGVKHIFFIAETKGSMSQMQITPIERSKIRCAEKIFNNISTSNVRYHQVDNYDNMLEVIRSIE